MTTPTFSIGDRFASTVNGIPGRIIAIAVEPGTGETFYTVESNKGERTTYYGETLAMMERIPAVRTATLLRTVGNPAPARTGQFALYQFFYFCDAARDWVRTSRVTGGQGMPDTRADVMERASVMDSFTDMIPGVAARWFRLDSQGNPIRTLANVA